MSLPGLYERGTINASDRIFTTIIPISKETANSDRNFEIKPLLQENDLVVVLSPAKQHPGTWGGGWKIRAHPIDCTDQSCWSSSQRSLLKGACREGQPTR